MKTILTVSAVLAVALTLTTPAQAGPHGRYRGQKRHCHVTGGVAYAAPAYYVAPPYIPQRVRSGFYFGFGGPGFYAGIGAPALYGPARFAVAPPVIVAPRPVWVPGHYAYDDGARLYVQGYWRR